MSKVRLIPYTVDHILTDTKVVPPGVSLIEAPKLWVKGVKGAGTVVAVLDTGCDPNHFEFRDQIIDGRNFTTDDRSNPDNFNDYSGHGTHVCGTVAAAENGAGVIGVAPLAKLLIVKVLSGRGYGETEWVINGIRYAMNWRGPNGERVRVISMSLGGPNHSPRLHQAVKDAIDSDILVVCAAGNEGDGDYRTDEFAYPGAYPEVIQVGSVSLDLEPSTFSNTNCTIDLVAPGEKILSTYLHGGFATLSGTSMATPHISGALALLIEKCEKSFGRSLTEAELYAQLIKRTTSLGLDQRKEGNGFLRLASSETSLSKDRLLTK